MGGGAWWAAVHGVSKSQSRARLSDFTFTFHFPALEKEMATRSSVLAWRIPGMGEPGGLPSMGSHSVRHDGSDLAVHIHSQKSLHISYCFVYCYKLSFFIHLPASYIHTHRSPDRSLHISYCFVHCYKLSLFYSFTLLFNS